MSWRDACLSVCVRVYLRWEQVSVGTLAFAAFFCWFRVALLKTLRKEGHMEEFSFDIGLVYKKNGLLLRASFR